MDSHMRHGAGAERSGRQQPCTSRSWLTVLGFKPQVTWRNAIAFLVHCSASILFLVFLNASQPFLIHQLEARSSKNGSAPPSKAGSLSGSLIFYDELLSTFASLIWGALAEIVGLAAVTSTSYLFIAIGLVSYTFPTKPWPDLIPARLVFAIGGSGATAMLSGILSEYSGSKPNPSSLETHFSSQQSQSQDSETASQGTLRPEQSNAHPDAAETDRLLTSETTAFTGARQKHLRARLHGRAAAIAGVFTGLGALISVFVLVRLPQSIADYFEDHDFAPTLLPHEHKNGGGEEDLMLQRATVATFWLVAALALLVAATTAVGLRQQNLTQRPTATDALSHRSQRHQDGDYGALHDSTIALAEDTRQARRARLRQRLERRSQTSLGNVVRSHIHRFISTSVGGFSMVFPVRRTNFEDAKTIQARHRLAFELRMAYLGGALARAFTIGTTAFLPLLVTHHYYTSGLCRQLPSPSPEAPLPNDDLKKLCRSAFTATAILGGTAQLTALLASPVIGILCDTLSPTSTVSITSALGAVGFYLLGVGTGGFAGDERTGEETPDPLTVLSIGAAVLVGVGQIGAIVGSLAGCARARSLIAESETGESTAVSHGGEEAADTGPATDTLVPGRDGSSHRNQVANAGTDLAAAADAEQGAGAIAGAYTCTGSLSILVISKLGGFLFDMYVPSPFLLIGGFSLFVSLCGIGIVVAKRISSL
ncbi:uncharacterized protein MEPE_00208 [Melanopsichium pennsylvanicum]|uniref:MFS general substrate transporter n=2 Tax=Melanopsichium pennsylvanicum TaxID=63383 RepID=A0AAJ4XHX9_9BASI|nr:conserved hypothetical protein [Melanopsichium pennsylvanicum 4]SNX81503.1 uncharacterized protein MEPE_00208 [Melanopsichium pennsylvanicum]